MPYSSDDMIENEHEFNNHQANKRQGIPVSTLLITGINQIHFPTRVINRPCTRVPIILFWNVIGGAKKNIRMKFGQIVMFQVRELRIKSLKAFQL